MDHYEVHHNKVFLYFAKVTEEFLFQYSMNLIYLLGICFALFSVILVLLNLNLNAIMWLNWLISIYAADQA